MICQELAWLHESAIKKSSKMLLQPIIKKILQDKMAKHIQRFEISMVKIWCKMNSIGLRSQKNATCLTPHHPDPPVCVCVFKSVKLWV